MTVEEYIQYEWTADGRHEYINGQLFEIPGEKDINNEVAGLIHAFLLHLKSKGFQIYNHDVKVTGPGGAKYHYPMCL